MHTLLFVITGLAVAVATALAVVLARLLREDRERSNARVAALALLAAEPAASNEIGPAPVRWAQQAAAASSPNPLRSGAEEPADVVLRDVPADAAHGLFAEREAASPWGRRFAVIGGFAVVLAAVLLAARFGGGHEASAAPAGRSAAPQVAAAAPLELVELRHTRETAGLTISGVVRNPAGSATVSHLVATAFVFGPDGTFLTSSRSPVQRATLAPNDESPFVLAIPVNGPVARYRIGFRTEDGQVLAHVDKRTAETLASKQEQP
jgi:hypothetical protein